MENKKDTKIIRERPRESKRNKEIENKRRYQDNERESKREQQNQRDK